MPHDPLASVPASSPDGAFDALASEGANPASAAIDRMSPLEIVSLMNAEDAMVAGAVARELPAVARAIEAITERMRRGGRLIYIGAGTSGRLGALDALECPPTFNLPPDRVVSCLAGGAFEAAAEDAEDDAHAGADDLSHLAPTADDAVVGISASGRTSYVLGALPAARERGALTIGLACNAGSPLAEAVEIMIAPLVGPEVIAGSTRLKAGTAQKMVLNMLSTGVMVLLGKTYGNLMVDVQATNQKLRARALRIVRETTALDEPAAAALLDDADGEAKTAILMARANLTATEARARLAAHADNLRAALEAGR